MGRRASPGRLSGEILEGLKSREIARWFLWRKEMESNAICGRVRFGLVFSFSADQTAQKPVDESCAVRWTMYGCDGDTRAECGSEYG